MKTTSTEILCTILEWRFFDLNDFLFSIAVPKRTHCLIITLKYSVYDYTKTSRQNTRFIFHQWDDCWIVKHTTEVLPRWWVSSLAWGESILVWNDSLWNDSWQAGQKTRLDNRHSCESCLPTGNTTYSWVIWNLLLGHLNISICTELDMLLTLGLCIKLGCFI